MKKIIYITILFVTIFSTACSDYNEALLEGESATYGAYVYYENYAFGDLDSVDAVNSSTKVIDDVFKTALDNIRSFEFLVAHLPTGTEEADAERKSIKKVTSFPSSISLTVADLKEAGIDLTTINPCGSLIFYGVTTRTDGITFKDFPGDSNVQQDFAGWAAYPAGIEGEEELYGTKSAFKVSIAINCN